jgi:pimeloyl-ACP methyl ester carboxylesterase
MVLVGASMGGAAALDFALTYPEAVAKLVLIDSAGLASGSPVGKWLFPPLDRWATQFLASAAVRRQVSLKAYLDPAFVNPDAELCAALHLQMPRWSEGLISFTKSGGYGSYGSVLKQLAMKTLILWGRNDQILGTKDGPKFGHLISKSRLQWIEACGHVPHLERPDLTATAIVDFWLEH